MSSHCCFFLKFFPSAYQNILLIFYCIKMSSHQASSKPRSSKCRHFCFPFDLHNYCPTCRESGTQADLEGAAETLFSSPPRPQPLRFESLSLKTPRTVPPTPGSALQNKIEGRLEKSLGSSLNIQLKQEMGVFQACMLEAMKNLRDEMLSFHQKASESGVDKTCR